MIAISGEPINEDVRSFLQHAKLLSVAENWALNDRRNQLRAEFHALMKERGVDIIICPAYVGSAPVRKGTDYGTYTMLWNMLDQPALVFPTGDIVTAELDPIDRSYAPTNPIDKQQFEKCMYRA
jgi:amidase